MKAEANSPFEQWNTSPGQAYLNRAHVRTFSLNILQMNGLELVEAVRRLRDPEDGLILFADENREAGNQAHRELSRHFHNFLSAAKTLVDHTRVLIREHYKGTPLLTAYEQKAGSEVGAKPVVKFVHDLRNYIVHCGLPNIVRSLNMTRDPGQIGAGFTANLSVYLKVGGLLTWSKWSVSARRFLEEAGDTIEVQGLVELYLTEIAALHAWLDNELAQVHQHDVKQALILAAQVFGDQPRRRRGTSIGVTDTSSPLAKFAFAEGQRQGLDKTANDLFANVRVLSFEARRSSFKGHRPVSVTLTPKDFVQTPVFRGIDKDGVPVVSFIEQGSKVYGMNADAFYGVGQIAHLAHEAPWALEGFGFAFVESQFIAWCRRRFENEDIAFSSFLADEAREAIMPRTVWTPVAHFEVEAPFEFGPVTVAPITCAVIDAFRDRFEPKPEQAEVIDAYFRRLRDEAQGMAAIVLHIEAEPKQAEERALSLARTATSLLRFFAPGAALVDVICPMAVLGSEHVPGSTVYIDGEAGFTSTSRIDVEQVSRWQMPATQLPQLKSAGLDIVGRLVSGTDLTPLEADVRSSLLVFTQSLTLGDARFRLSQSLVALEGLLLRHQMEPRIATVSERAGLIAAGGAIGLGEMAALFRRSYRLLELPNTRSLWPSEIETARTTVVSIHRILGNIIENTSNFSTRAEFIDAIERLRDRLDESVPVAQGS